MPSIRTTKGPSFAATGPAAPSDYLTPRDARLYAYPQGAAQLPASSPRPLRVVVRPEGSEAPAPRPDAPALPGGMPRAQFAERLQTCLHQAIADGGPQVVPTWYALAPDLAASLCGPPYAFAQGLKHLDSAVFDARRVELARHLLRTCYTQSENTRASRQLVAMHSILDWTQTRYPHEPAVKADRLRLYRMLSTVEARAGLRATLLPGDIKPLGEKLDALLHEAKQLDKADCIAEHDDVFITGGLFAAGHIILGAALSLGCAVAWCVGAPACFEFVGAFFGIGAVVAVTWSALYALLWLYHGYAPWETGSRDGPPRTQRFA